MSRNILVLGATGGTGRQVVVQALAAGHRVTAVARRPEALAALHHERLRIAPGDATDPAHLAAVVPGQDAVICALGAPGRDGSRVRERGTRAAIAAMRDAGVARLVVLSSYGIAETRAHLPLWIRYLLVPIALGPGFADHEAQEALVRDSGLDWTLVRPPFLTDDPPAERIVQGASLKGSRMKISREDVARVLLNAATQSLYIHEAIAISA